MALALPAPTRPARRTARPLPRLVPLTSTRPLSALDRTMQRLHAAHAQHVTGPTVPCPLCFTPPLHTSF